MTSRAILKYWLPVILWMVLIYVASTTAFSAEHTSRFIRPILRLFFPHASEPELRFLHGIVRKAAHLTEYFVLGLLLFRAFRRDSPGNQKWRWATLSLLACVLFAAGDEFHQLFVSTRTASIVDVGIDSLGGFLAQCAMLVKQRRRVVRYSPGRSDDQSRPR
jgi:VanZ family protein